MTALVLTPSPVDAMGITETITGSSAINLTGEGVAISEQSFPGIGTNLAFTDPLGIVEPAPSKVLAFGPATFNRNQSEFVRMGDNGQLLGIVDNYIDVMGIAETPNTKLVATRTFNDPMGLTDTPVYSFNLTFIYHDIMGIVEPAPQLVLQGTGSSGVAALTSDSTLSSTVVLSVITALTAAGQLTAAGFVVGGGQAQLTGSAVVTATVTQSVKATLTAAAKLTAAVATPNATLLKFTDLMGIAENAPQPVFPPKNFTRNFTDIMHTSDTSQQLVNVDLTHYISNTFVGVSGDYFQTAFALYHGGVWVYPAVWILVSGTWIQIQ